MWTQLGTKLVGSDAAGTANQGTSVSISADGNTALVGGPDDNNLAGAAWVWTRSEGVWTQQGTKLVGTGAVGALQGVSVSLSADGNTALVGGEYDNDFVGAAWVWTRSGGVWTQQGSKLVGTGAVGPAYQGNSVSLSADGNTALVGGPLDNGGAGAAWVWTRSGGVWTQQGPKLVGTGAVGPAIQGCSVSLSADGNTAIVGIDDSTDAGAAWVWTRSGAIWTQQEPKLVGAGSRGESPAGPVRVPLRRRQYSHSSEDTGTIRRLGPRRDFWTRGLGVWTQLGSKLVGTSAVGAALMGVAVSLSADGNTALVGGGSDNANAGAAWVFTLG